MELRKYWEIVCRRKWVLIQAVILIPLSAYILMKVVPPVYQSHGKLMVKVNTLQQKFIKDIPSEIGKFEYIDQDNAMGTIKEILESHSVAGRVIEEMNLRDEDGTLLDEKDFISPNKLKLIYKKKGVVIKHVADSEIFNIKGYSSEASEANKIAKEVIRAFLDTFSKMYKEEAKKAREVINAYLLDEGKRLKEAEQSLEDYRTENKVYDITTQITTLMTEISNLESSRYSTLRSIEETKVRLKNIKEAPWIAEQEDFKSVEVKIDRNAVLDAYKSQLLTLETALARLTVEYTQEHQDVKVVKQQIEVVNEKIREEISKLFATQITGRDSFFDSIAQKYADDVTSLVGLTAREKVLGEQIKEREKILNEIPEKERRLIELSRERDNLRLTYNSLILNLETTKTAEAMDLANAFVFQQPTLYENIKDNLFFPPKKKAFYLAITTFVAIFFGTFLVFLLEYLDDALWSPHEIEKSLNQKVIGVVPKFPRWSRNIWKIERSSHIDSVYNLLANIKLFKGEELGKVISIISPMKREGKSLLASLMASTLAQQGQKVVLIDGNLRYPSLHHIFNLSNETGLGDYLLDNILIQEIIGSTSIKGLNVITGGAVLTNPQKYLDSDKFSGLIKTLMPNYDVILLDTPAFINGSDALIISKLANDVLCVVAYGDTTREDIQRLMTGINSANIRITGFVLNKHKVMSS